MTIHDDARAAFEKVYDDALSAAVSGEAEANKVIEAQKVEIARLNALVESLQPKPDPVPEGWAVLYDTTFAEDDGWEKRQETQANDNSYNVPRNAVFGDGLRVLGKRETVGGRPFTTADVLGRHIRVPNYFRAEVTATLPTEYGTWPCPLWFRPLTHGDSGEIDVCETWPYDWARTGPQAWVTVWENYTTKRKENAGILYSRLPNPDPDPAAAHTYTVEKVKDRITFWIDGVLVYSWEKTNPVHGSAVMNTTIRSWWDSVYEIPDREWYPRITLQIGGGSNNPDPLPEFKETEMVVHRLRIYKEA